MHKLHKRRGDIRGKKKQLGPCLSAGRKLVPPPWGRQDAFSAAGFFLTGPRPSGAQGHQVFDASCPGLCQSWPEAGPRALALVGGPASARGEQVLTQSQGPLHQWQAPWCLITCEGDSLVLEAVVSSYPDDRVTFFNLLVLVFPLAGSQVQAR